jgi:hypothetical protein
MLSGYDWAWRRALIAAGPAFDPPVQSLASGAQRLRRIEVGCDP